MLSSDLVLICTHEYNNFIMLLCWWAPLPVTSHNEFLNLNENRKTLSETLNTQSLTELFTKLPSDLRQTKIISVKKKLYRTAKNKSIGIASLKLGIISCGAHTLLSLDLRRRSGPTPFCVRSCELVTAPVVKLGGVATTFVQLRICTRSHRDGDCALINHAELIQVLINWILCSD